MLLDEIANTSKRIAMTRSRIEKIEYLAVCLKSMAPDEIPIGVAYLTGNLHQGRIGLGPSTIHKISRQVVAANTATLTLHHVNQTIEQIANIKGTGSVKRRAELLGGLLAVATSHEQDFLARLILGELRQGALEGVMIEAIARTADVSSTEIRRAVMLAGDTRSVAYAALTRGAAALGEFSIQILSPVKPMLADSADQVVDALHRLGSAAFEFKLDGARVQVHKSGETVRLFSRQLNDVTAAVPEVVELMQALPSRELILDGEVLALREDGSPYPFQHSMRRFGRKTDVEEMRKNLPLRAFFFDCLYLDGKELIDRPQQERFNAMKDCMPSTCIIPHIVTADSMAAERFFSDAVKCGHEGVMAKSLDALYEAGNRGSGWLKLKHVYTLDLVVLAAEWGSGRRRGWLSNLHLGARDPATNQFVMLGKTFKGITDKMLAWQTQKLRELELETDGYVVHVRPELVVEIAFNELQASSQYPGGLALRFARVKSYRTDKKAAEADTIETVRSIYEKSYRVNHEDRL